MRAHDLVNHRGIFSIETAAFRSPANTEARRQKKCRTGYGSSCPRTVAEPCT